jgi:hypothetical protein
MILVVRPEGKRPLGIPKPRWEDNIKVDLQELGWGVRDWIDLAQVRDRWKALLKALMNLQVENCAFLGYYAARNGFFLPTFRDNLPVPSAWVDL